ncbi:MAG TPA: hypothetical protein VFZ40_05825 [Pyrinomonadaceae bacterium]
MKSERGEKGDPGAEEHPDEESSRNTMLKRDETKESSANAIAEAGGGS